MTFKINDNYSFGIYAKCQFLPVYTTGWGIDDIHVMDLNGKLVYEPKDGKLDRKYYIKGDKNRKMLMLGYDYSKEGFKHTVEASYTQDSKDGILGTPCKLESSVQYDPSESTRLSLDSQVNNLSNQAFGLIIQHKINEHLTVSSRQFLTTNESSGQEPYHIGFTATYQM